MTIKAPVIKTFGAISLMVGLLCFWPVQAQENTSTSPHPHPQGIHDPRIEHVEITLPKSLLKGFILIDQSLSMEEAVEIGLENNLEIQVSEAETGVRKALWKQAKAKRWPIVSAGSLSFVQGGDSQLLRTPGMMMRTVGDNTFTQEFSLYSRMPIYTGGLIRGGIKANRFAWEGSQAGLKDMMVEMAFQIRQAYLSAALAKIQHHIHQQHIHVQEELLRIVKSKYRHGKGLKADVLRVQAGVAEARQHLNTHHNHLNHELFELKARMGVDLGSDIRLSEALRYSSWQGESLSVLVNGAIKDHPEIIEAGKQVREAEAQLKVARSQYLPQVYGQVSGNIRIPENEPNGLGNGVVGMLTANLPVFDRERDAGVKAAKAKLIKAQMNLKNQGLNIAKNIAQVWSELEFAGENVSLAKPAVADAQEDLRLMNERYKVGKAIQVEVQDAILTLLQAQLNEAQAIYDYELAKIKLSRAIGKI